MTDPTSPAYQTPQQPDHSCCWHSESSYVLTTYPAQYPEVCCHCGVRRVRRQEFPPIPEGHGQFYPHTFQPFIYSGAGVTGTTSSAVFSATNGTVVVKNKSEPTQAPGITCFDSEHFHPTEGA